MATTRTFSDMLNEYLPNALLKEEFVKRDYLMKKIDKDNSWLGGNLVVPFTSAGASSVSFGSLTAQTDIAEEQDVRGGVPEHKEVWGSMIFNHRDLMEHGAISEQNLLKILPNQVEDFMDYIKNVVSTNLLNGNHFATLTSDGAADGSIIVDRPDRFVLKQKVFVEDDGTVGSSAAGFVQSIDMNTTGSTGTITLDTTRAGGVDLDLSTFLVANTARVYNDGATLAGTNTFSSLRSALLSAANGGGTSLYGQTKTSAPYLQAINILGDDITEVNIVQKCFDALTNIRQKGKGRPTDIAMSYKNFGAVLKAIEASKGSFNVVPESKKASQFGWEEIVIGSVTGGQLKFVGIQEADDDVIYYIDWRGLKFYSNGLFQKRRSPDGNQYFEIRNTTGYAYVVDVSLFGELVVDRPSTMGIIHSISF